MFSDPKRSSSSIKLQYRKVKKKIEERKIHWYQSFRGNIGEHGDFSRSQYYDALIWEKNIDQGDAKVNI